MEELKKKQEYKELTKEHKTERESLKEKQILKGKLNKEET